jgi:ribosomal protein S18 acetylase RimI-like enzyme
MLELRALDWPADRTPILALDTSYVIDRVLRLEVTARSASLVEEALPVAIGRSYSLAGVIDALQDYGWVRVASDGKEVVGLAVLAVERWNRRARLEHLYVAAGARLQGVGRALVEGAVGAAGSLGARGVWVETQTTNAGAVRFYERSGFRWCGFDTSLYDPKVVVDGDVGIFFWRDVHDGTHAP